MSRRERDGPARGTAWAEMTIAPPALWALPCRPSVETDEPRDPEAPGDRAPPAAATQPPAPPRIEASPQPVFLYRGTRYSLGYRSDEGEGQGHYAIWDLQTGEEQGAFPLTDDGWRQSWQAFVTLDAAASSVWVAPTKVERKRPARARILSIVGVLAGLAIVGIWRFALPAVTGAGGILNRTIFEDDFSEAGMWEDVDDGRVSAGLLDDGYRIRIDGPDGSFIRFAAVDDAWPNVSVEVDVVQVAHPTGSDDAAGVTCDVTGTEESEDAYAFVIAPVTGEYAILSPDRLVAQGNTSGVVTVGEGATNNVRGHCRGATPGEPATLALYVNGEKVLEAEDPGGFTAFRGVGMAAFSQLGGSDFRFDNLVMKRL